MSQVLTKSQESRRRRILETALQLAEVGGYDAVQMREVATGADVALGTLYRYFPSKDHLLLSGMAAQIDEMRERFRSHPPKGAGATERVVDVLDRATRGFMRRRHVMTAMLRALVAADESLAPLVIRIRTSMSELITQVMRNGDTDVSDEAVARAIEYVWMGSLVSWINGVQSSAQVAEDLRAATRLLLDGR